MLNLYVASGAASDMKVIQCCVAIVMFWKVRQYESESDGCLETLCYRKAGQLMETSSFHYISICSAEQYTAGSCTHVGARPRKPDRQVHVPVLCEDLTEPPISSQTSNWLNRTAEVLMNLQLDVFSDPHRWVTFQMRSCWMATKAASINCAELITLNWWFCLKIFTVC